MIPACPLSCCGRTGHPSRRALLRRDKGVLLVHRSRNLKTLALALGILFSLALMQARVIIIYGLTLCTSEEK